MNRPLATLAVCAVSLVVLTGCGSDDSADTSAEAGASASSSTGEQAPEGTSPSPQPEEQPQAADAPGTGTKYCDLLSSDLATAFSGLQSPEGVDKVVKLFGEVSQAAPENVGQDWKTMQTALAESKPQIVEGAKIQQQVQAGELTQKQAIAKAEKLQKSMKNLQSPEFQQASMAVGQHASQYCGVGAGPSAGQ